MTFGKIVPWGQKHVPIRRTEEYNRPTVWPEFDEPWRDVERLFDRFLDFSPAVSTTMEQFNPVLDVHETEKEFQINVEVPGMNENEIEVSMSKDMLTISGEKKEEREENTKGIYRLERRYGSFSRSIPLPDNCVETEKAEAIYKNGVLSIKLPKAVGYKESIRKIPVLKSKSEDNNSDSGQTG